MPKFKGKGGGGPFNMRSGNGPLTFKTMGSSPAKDMKTGSYKQSFESPVKQKDGWENPSWYNYINPLYWAFRSADKKMNTSSSKRKKDIDTYYKKENTTKTKEVKNVKNEKKSNEKKMTTSDE